MVEGPTGEDVELQNPPELRSAPHRTPASTGIPVVSLLVVGFCQKAGALGEVEKQ